VTPFRRFRLVLAAVAVLCTLAGAGAWLWLRSRPQPASTAGFTAIPATCLFAVHADLEALRASSLFRGIARWAAPPELEKDYADFVRQTGFDYERDLRFAAIGVSGPAESRIVDAVLEGDFDRAKLGPYMAARRKAAASCLGQTIEAFQGPSGRLFRLCFVGGRRLLFSNAPGEEEVRRMVGLSVNGGESLAQRLAQLHVVQLLPRGSQVWVSADLERGARLSLPAGPGSDTSFSLDVLRGGRAAVVSAQFQQPSVVLHLAAEYASRADAERAADSLRGLAALLRLLASRDRRAPASGPDLARAMESVSVGVRDNAAVVDWPLDARLLDSLFEPQRHKEH
jgi:hypothetical protein